MKRYLAAGLIVALLGVLAILLEIRQPARQEIVVAIEAEPITLDPFNAVDHISPVIQQVIFEGLLALGENNTVLPQLATEFAVSEDGRAITFTLRRDVRFHDGTPFDAAAVKQNFAFLLDASNEMARRYLFDFIDAITVNNPYSITFTSKRADYALPYYFAHPAAGIKSAQELDKRARDPLHNLTHTAVGTGPFRLILWHGRRYVELEPNPYYWNADLKPKTHLRFLFVPDPKERLAMLKQGKAHAAFPAASTEPASAVGLTTLRLPRQEVYFVGFNFARRELSDVRVRRAMNYAVDRERLMTAAGIQGLALATPISPAIFGHAAVQPLPHNPARARSLLAEADFAQAAPLELLVADRRETKALALAVQADLAAVGIGVEVVALPQGELFTRLDTGKPPDMWLMHWRPYAGEVYEVLSENFTRPDASHKNNNAGGYFNAELEKRLAEARAQPMAAALAELARLQALVLADAPWLFLSTPVRYAAYTQSVEGIDVGPNGALRLSRVRFRP